MQLKIFNLPSIKWSVVWPKLPQEAQKSGFIVVNISQIKHTWFSFVFLFVTDLSNYNADVFTGKRRARMEGIRAFILSVKRESENKAYTESPTKNIGNLPSTIKSITLSFPEAFTYNSLLLISSWFNEAIQRTEKGVINEEKLLLINFIKSMNNKFLHKWIIILLS